MSSILAIEIGGTKLQLAVGQPNDAQLAVCERYEVVRESGASGILAQIESALPRFKNAHRPSRVAIGFGGPVDAARGIVRTSHQIAGWDDFPIVQWCESLVDCPVLVENDCNVAALAEATLGAGRGLSRVFYVTVGTGIGGGFILDGKIDGQGREAIAEIGHLRPGTTARSSTQTVESIASGLGLERLAQSWLHSVASTPNHSDASDRDDLLQRCGGNAAQLSAQLLAEAARSGNRTASNWIDRATETLGWAIAQTITLLAPECVVVGGGVTKSSDSFLDRVREHVRQYVFPPLAESYRLVPAELGENVVLHGAIQLAASPDETRRRQDSHTSGNG